jgi:hypothetical protein
VVAGEGAADRKTERRRRTAAGTGRPGRRRGRDDQDGDEVLVGDAKKGNGRWMTGRISSGEKLRGRFRKTTTAQLKSGRREYYVFSL